MSLKNMGYSEPYSEKSGRKRHAEHQEFYDDEDDDNIFVGTRIDPQIYHCFKPKRLCSSAEKEELGAHSSRNYECPDLESTEDIIKGGVDLEYNNNVSEADEIFLYSTENELGAYNSIFARAVDKQIVEADLDTSNANTSQIFCTSGGDFASSEPDNSYTDTALADLQRKKNEVGCYEHEDPLQGLELLFDDAALDFGVHEDDNLEFIEKHPVVDQRESQFCSDAGASTVTSEQAFIEENDVHDWLFSADQASPSLGYCTNDLLEPSLAHVLEGMAGS